MIIELSGPGAAAERNLQRWAELLSDPMLARFDGRIETDRYGRIIMSPPPAPKHGRFQWRIASALKTLLPDGETFTECPISTADGVKAADIAWASAQRMAELGESSCFPRCPEICVEVLSPGNSGAEIEEKTRLYFEAGAEEVWTCDDSGVMTFRGSGVGQLPTSRLARKFPQRIELH